MVRDRGFTDVFDLGTLASEIADVHGSRSFGVPMLGGAGTMHAVIDARAFTTVEAPVKVAAMNCETALLTFSNA